MVGLRQLSLQYRRFQSLPGDLVLMLLSSTLAPGCRSCRVNCSSSCCTVTAMSAGVQRGVGKEPDLHCHALQTRPGLCEG